MNILDDVVFIKDDHEEEDGGFFGSIKSGVKDMGDGAASLGKGAVDTVNIGNIIFLNLR